MRKRIRLTESQLHRVIKESVKRMLKESDEDTLTAFDRAKQEIGYQIVSMYNNNLDSFDHESFESWCEDGKVFKNMGLPDDVCDECINLMREVAPLIDEVTNLLTFEHE